jgi:hypothetical protein
MTRGVYISQKESRRLGVPQGADHPDLLFDGRTSPSGKRIGMCLCPTQGQQVCNSCANVMTQICSNNAAHKLETVHIPSMGW